MSFSVKPRDAAAFPLAGCGVPLVIPVAAAFIADMPTVHCPSGRDDSPGAAPV